MFRWPFDIDYLNTELSWQLNAGTTFFNIERLQLDLYDTSLLADGQFVVTDERTGLNLYAELAHSDISQAPKFLPVGVMDEELVTFLDESIKSGQLSNTQVLLRGSAQRFPYQYSEVSSQSLATWKMAPFNMIKTGQPLRRLMPH